MIKLYKTIGAIIMVCILSACTGRENNGSILLPELMEAEKVMYEYPDSALHILQDVETLASSDKMQYATWALLTVQAKYKNYMEQPSDSLINVAYDYFMKQNDAQRKAMTLYYKGALCYEDDKVEEAQKFYLQAKDEVEKTEDHQLAHLIYIELGNLYVFRSFYEYALENFEKALHHAQLANNENYICTSYISLARANSALKQMKTSIEYYQKAIQLAEKIKNNNLRECAMNEIAGIYASINDSQSAMKYAQQALQLKKGNKDTAALGPNYLVLGEIYRHLNIPDSAYHYLNKALSSSSIYTIRTAYQALYYLSRENKEYQKMSGYCDKLLIYQDSIQKLKKSKELAKMQKKYDQQKIINEKNKLKIEKDKTIRIGLIVLIVLLCLSGSIIYIYQQKLHQKERMLQKKEEEINKNLLRIQQNEIMINRNISRMEELSQQIEENKTVQEQLEEQQKTLAEIQQQNVTLKQENEALQKDIDKYSISLTEKSNEQTQLAKLAKENQYLRTRETFLVSWAIQNTKVLNKLKGRKNPIEDVCEWEEIKKSINFLFNNYAIRLSELVPTLSDGELNMCCLIKLHLSNSNIADLMGISPMSIAKKKMRLKERIIQKKGSLGECASLDLWLWEF